MEDYPKVNAICRYGHSFFEVYLRGSTTALADIEKPDSAFIFYAWEVPGAGLQVRGEEPPASDGAR